MLRDDVTDRRKCTSRMRNANRPVASVCGRSSHLLQQQRLAPTVAYKPGLLVFRRNLAFRAIGIGFAMFVRSTRQQLLEYLENRLT